MKYQLGIFKAIFANYFLNLLINLPDSCMLMFTQFVGITIVAYLHHQASGSVKEHYLIHL